jgi:alpha-galactosidase/6-phospho-beta-glucosidase family protein
MTNRHISNHQLLIKAFDTKDLSYARLALSQDPLTEHLNPDEINQMFDTVINAIQPYLTHYSSTKR